MWITLLRTPKLITNMSTIDFLPYLLSNLALSMLIEVFFNSSSYFSIHLWIHESSVLQISYRQSFFLRTQTFWGFAQKIPISCLCTNSLLWNKKNSFSDFWLGYLDQKNLGASIKVKKCTVDGHRIISFVQILKKILFLKKYWQCLR